MKPGFIAGRYGEIPALLQLVEVEIQRKVVYIYNKTELHVRGDNVRFSNWRMCCDKRLCRSVGGQETADEW